MLSQMTEGWTANISLCFASSMLQAPSRPGTNGIIIQQGAQLCHLAETQQHCLFFFKATRLTWFKSIARHRSWRVLHSLFVPEIRPDLKLFSLPSALKRPGSGGDSNHRTGWQVYPFQHTWRTSIQNCSSSTFIFHSIQLMLSLRKIEFKV